MEHFLWYVATLLNKHMYYGVDEQYVPLAGWKINEFPQQESAKCRLDVPGLCSCLMQWLLLQQEHWKKKEKKRKGTTSVSSGCGSVHSALYAYYTNSHECKLISLFFILFSLFFVDEITNSFRRYGHLVVDWPHKAESKSYFPPKGNSAFSEHHLYFPHMTSKSTPINITSGASPL